MIQLAEFELVIKDTGFFVVEFSTGTEDSPAHWRRLESWRRSRAVTIADIRCSLGGGALDVALNSDIVYMREDSSLELPDLDAIPSPNLIWAAGRAGRPALRRLLLGHKDGETQLKPCEALSLNLIAAIVPANSDLPLPDLYSIPALTAARDLMRASGSGGGALEMATFRLLFANRDPNEGARAFIEKRDPDFEQTEGPRKK